MEKSYSRFILSMLKIIMFSSLKYDQFKLVAPLFVSLKHYVTLRSVFAGLTPGAVYVDDVDAPKTAVIAFNHRVYLAGDPTATKPETVNQFFRDTFMPILREKGQDSFVLYTSPEWESAMHTVLHDLHPVPRKRRYYRLDARQQAWQPQLPSGFTLRAVDADLLADQSLTNLDFVTEEMVSERPSLTDFLEKSFGCCVVHKNEVVGWCMSEYNSGNRCELGIETEGAFQRKGLAMAMATAVIQHAFTVGIHDIGWVCWANNLPSVATAEKLGFERVAETAVHLIFTDKAVAWGVQGNLRFEEDDYSGAATWYEKAAQADNVPDWIYWNAACVYAYLNQTDALFRHLYSAAEAGVTNVEMITNSRHFKHLHETAVWQTYLQHVENLQARGENDI